MNKHSFFAFLCAVIVAISACHKDNEFSAAPIVPTPVVIDTVPVMVDTIPVITDTIPVINDTTPDPRDAFIGTYTYLMKQTYTDYYSDAYKSQATGLMVISKGLNKNEMLFGNTGKVIVLDGSQFTMARDGGSLDRSISFGPNAFSYHDFTIGDPPYWTGLATPTWTTDITGTKLYSAATNVQKNNLKNQ